MISMIIAAALALALAILAGLRIIETDAVLGVFVAGAAFGNRLTDDLRAELGYRRMQDEPTVLATVQLGVKTRYPIPRYRRA